MNSIPDVLDALRLDLRLDERGNAEPERRQVAAAARSVEVILRRIHFDLTIPRDGLRAEVQCVSTDALVEELIAQGHSIGAAKWAVFWLAEDHRLKVDVVDVPSMTFGDLRREGSEVIERMLRRKGWDKIDDDTMISMQRVGLRPTLSLPDWWRDFFRNHQEKQEEYAELQDGPVPPNRLRWKGATYSIGKGRSPLSWRLLDYFWDRQRESFDDLIGKNKPWTDAVTDNAVSTALTRFKNDIPRWFPWFLRAANGYVYKEFR
jgi:hypothetical protein